MVLSLIFLQLLNLSNIFSTLCDYQNQETSFDYAEPQRWYICFNKTLAPLADTNQITKLKGMASRLIVNYHSIIFPGQGIDN